MVNVDKASVVKLKTHGSSFEILVDPNQAIAFREGKVKDVGSILAVEKVFADAKKGLEASTTQMKQIFKSDDPLEVAKIILQKGDVPLTKEYKDNLREQKKRQIITYIHRNTVDPQSHTPHPVTRIEAGIEEINFKVNEMESVDKQVQDLMKKLRPILPLKFEVKEISITIEAKYAHKCYQTLKNSGKMLKEEWQQNGSLKVLIEIPGGIEQDLYSNLASITHGTIESEVVKTK